ncbi:MAG: hypothetical protein HKL88_06300 [Bacteroidia bacterium]|jgi:dsDNA-specific endonuclease/ATPase MutS2|nr:hypothetical protein [Bacteroidia bacterium]
MLLNKGDKVRFLYEKGEGIVKKILSGNKVLVELAEGLDIEVKRNELVAVADLSLSSLEIVAKDMPLQAGTGNIRGAKSKPHANSEKVVDLHFEIICPDAGYLNNAQKLNLQLNFFQTELDKALRGHLTKITFVHGVGNGVLRNAVRNILKGYEGIEFYDASYSNYGAGATTVRIIARNRTK